MAKLAGISLRSVQRIWDAHQLQRRIGCAASVERSRDPRFAETMADVVGHSTSIRLPRRVVLRRSTRQARSRRLTALSLVAAQA